MEAVVARVVDHAVGAGMRDVPMALKAEAAVEDVRKAAIATAAVVAAGVEAENVAVEGTVDKTEEVEGAGVAKREPTVVEAAAERTVNLASETVVDMMVALDGRGGAAMWSRDGCSGGGGSDRGGSGSGGGSDGGGN